MSLNWSRWLACVLCVGISACTGPAVVISPGELPSAVEGTLYTAVLDLEASGSASWRIVSGSLPPGLAIESDTGVISGIGQSPGTFDFGVSVELRTFPPRSGEAALSITIIERLTLEAALAPARAEQDYAETLRAAGGVPPLTFDVIGLPAGLDFDADTGEVSGTPLTANQGLTVQATVIDNGDPQQLARELITLVVKPVLIRVATESLADGVVGALYVAQLVAENGAPPYQWAVVAGVLPDGMRLNLDSGTISGTPPRAQAATFTIEVSDDSDPPERNDREFTITVSP